MTPPCPMGGRCWSWWRPTLPTAGGIVAAIGVWSCLTRQKAPISDEGHVVETLQAGLWGFSALVALLAIARQPASADRGFAAWMAAVGLVALWRALDLHVVLNQLFPVRFKSLWLLDPTVPWWHRTTWVVLGIGLATALVAPLWRRCGPLMALLCGGDAGIGLIAIALACLVLGYVVDDVVGRGLVLSRSHSRIIEETIALLDVLAWCASSLVHWRWPLTSKA